MKAINIFCIIIISGVTAFFSVFYLGSYEEYKQLINQLPFSFVSRVIGVTTIGLIGLLVLIAVNFLFEKVFIKKANIIALKQLAYTGFLWVFSIAFLGCLIFFFG